LYGLSEEAQVQGDDLYSAIFQAYIKVNKNAWQLAQKKERIMVLQNLLDWQKRCY
jgi:hypothetical protein